MLCLMGLWAFYDLIAFSKGGAQPYCIPIKTFQRRSSNRFRASNNRKEEKIANMEIIDDIEDAYNVVATDVHYQAPYRSHTPSKNSYQRMALY
ncbi:hypothetical protein KP509_24G013700 [Ceratopteris richardii]|uniref:Uncharacterized protein n=1 Tax=Ceratopteris richardii TaxID=49495 RepID=A0A8T2RVA9_CERRI|nr:hypothetical protein KP509_24G013700 [Ceratopteris richardii]